MSILITRVNPVRFQKEKKKNESRQRNTTKTKMKIKKCKSANLKINVMTLYTAVRLGHTSI